ncbi:MAG: hypothetical protein HYS17_00995 [Micavibrio aeruginosavorus]|uniref:Uncharacterized protein n=1 Tax=Micavibrio aeruginosavorus TaxID=349221 RepID=A0A7T5UHG2_9BACT|nr:MAG: hypothetical protein HYS17_00995 [Micavibrio aeruginosavorus]
MAFSLAWPESAWPFEITSETESYSHGGVVAAAAMRLDPSISDPCLYLLKPLREQESFMAADRRYREASGSAMAVGLVLGVRFALGPQERAGARSHARPVAAFHVWEPHQVQSPARAIADYRACRNQRTLQALID